MDLQKQAQIIERWRFNAELFVREALMVEEISNQQQEALQLVTLLVVAKWKKFKDIKLSKAEQAVVKKWGITIRSGKGTGKDALLSWIFLWFLICFENIKGMCTANSRKQLNDVLWAEIAKWINHSRRISEDGTSFISEIVEQQSERLYLNVNKRNSFISARSVNVQSSAEEQGEVLAGLHEDYMMLAVDEASGVPDGVIKPIETTLTGPVNFAILIGNMTKNHGYFYESHFTHSDYWLTLHWNSEKSDLKHLTRDFIETQAKKYGKDSNMYRMNVLGEPPLSEADALIPIEWLQQAQDRDIEPEEGMPHRFGIDPGDTLDRTGFIARKGWKANYLEEKVSRYTDVIAEWAQGIILSLTSDEDESYDNAFCDTIGVGNGVYSNMRRARFYMKSVRVNETKSMRKPDEFHRLRDELWWRVRDAFEEGLIDIPKDEEFDGLGEKLKGELSILKYNKDSGKIKIISKKELRKKGLASPNLADALMMTFALAEAVPRRRSDGRYDPNKMKTEPNHSWMGA
jgi:hypothetical protein